MLFFLKGCGYFSRLILTDEFQDPFVQLPNNALRVLAGLLLLWARAGKGRHCRPPSEIPPGAPRSGSLACPPGSVHPSVWLHFLCACLVSSLTCLLFIVLWRVSGIPPLLLSHICRFWCGELMLFFVFMVLFPAEQLGRDWGADRPDNCWSPGLLGPQPAMPQASLIQTQRHGGRVLREAPQTASRQEVGGREGPPSNLETIPWAERGEGLGGVEAGRPRGARPQNHGGRGQSGLESHTQPQAPTRGAAAIGLAPGRKVCSTSAQTAGFCLPGRSGLQRKPAEERIK